jgi:DNA-binding NtrC family response regulator
MTGCNCPLGMYGGFGFTTDCPDHGMISPEKRALDALNASIHLGKIPAIKAVRAATTWDLVRAKDFVETHVPQTRADFRLTLAQIIANAIADAIARHDGNVSAAARELGINRRTIYNHQKGVVQRQVNPSMLGRSRS